uniref:Uncharacterized protein n=1 Tax=Ditylenchus dipsaci TaxID=166011 RepID=A0A915EUL3_9BILA
MDMTSSSNIGSQTNQHAWLFNSTTTHQESLAQLVVLFSSKTVVVVVVTSTAAPAAISTHPQLPDMEIFSADDSDPANSTTGFSASPSLWNAQLRYDEDELPDILLECFNLPSVKSQVAAALPQEQRWNGIEERSPVRSPDQLSVAESPPLSPVAQSPVQVPVVPSPLPSLRRSSRKRAPRKMLQLDGKKCYKKASPYQ